MIAWSRKTQMEFTLLSEGKLRIQAVDSYDLNIPCEYHATSCPVRERHNYSFTEIIEFGDTLGSAPAMSAPLQLMIQTR